MTCTTFTELEAALRAITYPDGWLDFAAHMADGLQSDEVVYLFEKPWKYMDEYAEYLAEVKK